MTVLPETGWRSAPGLRRIVAALGEGTVKIVGGAVRDTLLGLPVTDVDLATPLLPEEVTRRLEAVDVKVIPTGIAHGTVTAIASGERHEITTLRRDVETDGRRATIAFADDWREDAARRDFTINALYADPDSGLVDDYFGGIADLRAGRVRFIGDAATRIAEDHLRILRFYRFAARFGSGDLEPASHRAVVAARQSLKSLSRERIADELLKILSLGDTGITGVMARDGIFEVLLPELRADFAAELRKLIANEGAAGVDPSPLRRLSALLPADPAVAEQVASRLRLSTRQRKHLAALAEHRGDVRRPVRQLAYSVGIDAARDIHLLSDDPSLAAAAVRSLTGWTIPRLPLKGGDIVARGVAAGPQVAAILKAVEAQWVAEDFPAAARVAELVDQKIG